ncbi:cellulose biosynthesis cyclic di-GMP-binding regulatory protein BcsB [Xanthomonas campestris pv. raphani]|uniref:cellulose biosynthesis cyclic di-GMP-binding regulatory protein BcsB n=1 Tax=Xanthomonas campestris TaxID=339 RepID=UPI002B23D76C|nr:cellulose biosynthesis cyclic di-GMP-binding regulatory protein BcsB [Xanthomonas campestris]MEA9748401.1 cellulose biosynthesis cyclic di-GMP-binding regulatory protein BcsB [Xanthomonas campestris pv. raphani]MEA9849108.1 cellulose biosynthesis cyclic di-GMP-binding regulatory protein BcsB [Xanthomonas campestris pv. raphani]MEA9930448.1 cellulose biosynthesis cyclic di-GMP-binding regulatory protein BcsB [Xanthomonas campestris pv. raphani]
MRISPAMLTCALTLLAGLAQAQQPAPAEAPAAMPTEQAAADATTMPVPSAPAAGSTRASTLRELGIDYEITLRGVQGSAGVPFSVRSDEIVTAATLNLKYSYSPSLLPDLSHLKVTINGVTVGTLPTDKANAGKLLSTDLPIDPRLVTDYNQLNLQLIGHYTRECEDPDHSSLWANVDAATTLSLTTTPLALANNLALLPVPFFDVRDTRRLELPFYFPQQPDMATLQAAGTVASWFGTLAGYRGATFPASTSALPATGNAVVFATPATLPPQFATADSGVADIRGPTVAVVVNPTDPNGKLLLVLGRNAEELQRAATALALRAPLTGAVARIGELSAPAPRAPYDAPKWVSSDRPVRFGDLVTQPSALNVTGYHPDLIRVGLQLPPDLFVWERDGIPIDLKYRYTVPDVDNKSALNVSINESFVTTLPLTGLPYAESTPMRWWNSLGTRGAMPVNQRLTLPVGAFSANSQLRFHFFFDRPQGEECKNSFPDVSGAIDADSTIDLSGFHHYMAMPNLAAFANAGYPFTRLADLSESAIVLPNNPGDQDLSNVLTLLGRFGASTGYPALHAQIIAPSAVQQHADRDLLLLGGANSQPLFKQWRANLPVGQDGQSTRFRLTDWLFDTLPRFLSFDARRTDLPTTAEIALQPQPDDVLLMGFESPLKSGRSVVAFQTEDPTNMSRLFDAWFDPALLKDFQGSVVVLQQKKVTSLVGNQTYYVGHLPLPTWLRWYFSHHPVWLAVTVILLALLMALAGRVLLRRHTAERLNEGRSA